MANRREKWRPGLVLARSMGYGAMTGAAVGAATVIVTAVVIEVREPSGILALLGLIGYAGVYAAGIGAVVGIACGITGGLALLCAGTARALRVPAQDGTARRQVTPAQRLVLGSAAGAGAALPPLAGLAYLGPRSGFAATVFLCLAAVVFLLGLLLGPAAAFGRRAIRARGHACRWRAMPTRQT